MWKSIQILILVLWLSPATAWGALGDHLWSQGWNAGGGASADGTGHIAAAGAFFGSIDLGGGTFNPVNIFGGDVFLARFDDDGNHVWSQQITPGGFGFSFNAMTTAPDGSIYLAGTLQNGDIDFGGGTIAGNGEFVLAAFESNGTHRWSFKAGSGTVKDLDASNGTLAVTGYTYGSVDFGGGTLTSAGGADLFVGVLNPNGTHRYSTIYGDTDDQGGMSIAVKNSGGVVLAATTESSIDFGGGPLTIAGTDLCLASFDSTGTHQWSFSKAGDFSPGAGILAELELDVSTTGTIALVGQFLGSLDLGGGTMNAIGQADVFVGLFDGAGAHLSSNSYGGSVTDGAQGVSFDGSGNLAIAGNFLSASLSFGGSALVHSGGFGSDWFVAVFDDAGVHQFSQAYTGNGQYLMKPTFPSTGGLLLTGSGGGNTDFGGGAVASTGLFVAMLEGASGTVTGSPPSRSGLVLAQNSPNPFNPSTTIRFRLDADARVLLEIFDVAGRRVRTLRNASTSAGPHEVVFDGRDAAGRSLASGIYRYRLSVGPTELVRSMVLVK